MPADDGLRESLRDLNRRACRGFEHTPFVLIFGFGVVLCGGMGVWIELFKLSTNPASSSAQAVRGAIATFGPAVLGATSLQMIYDEPTKSSRGIASVLAAVSLLVFFAMSDGDLSDWVAFPAGLAASAASLWIWCVANGESPSFQEVQPNAAVGGDLALDAPLPGEDDLEGLQH